jgi:predicted nucleotidyltransferase
MGIQPVHAQPPISLADALFGSVEQRVLGLLFGQPEREFQGAELIRLAASGTGATHRMIKRLVRSGLVNESRSGRQRFYRANAESPVFDELSALIRKTVGLAGPLSDALAPLANRIAAAFVFGSVAAGRASAGSDIDVMVIADDLDYPTLFEAFQVAEERLGRRVDLKLVTPADWKRRRAQPGLFSQMAEGPRVFLLGDADVAG